MSKAKISEVREPSQAKQRGLDLAALRLAADAGWLAPIEELPDGSIRTALRVPEGV